MSAALDSLIAVHVFDLDLKPHRDLALARVGIRYVDETGNPFKLKDGRTVSMRATDPGFGCLIVPPGGDWNDRYYRRVAQFLGDQVAAEVDAYRLPALPYSTEIARAFDVVKAMRGKDWCIGVEPKWLPADKRGDDEIHATDWTATASRTRRSCAPGQAVYHRLDDASAARAICLVALMALGVDAAECEASR